MWKSEVRPSADLRRTPYQLTVSALIVPWRLHLLLNAVTGMAFGLVAGPALALLWVAVLSAVEAILQRRYRRLEGWAALVDSDRGLRRLAGIGLLKAVLWMSAPTSFAVTTRSPVGLFFVAVIAILVTALAVSTFRNSRLMFLSVALVPIAALAVCGVAVFGVRAGAGPLIGIGVVAVPMLFIIASGTNRTVAAWNQASQRTAEALADIKAALGEAEAASQAKSEFLSVMSHEIRTPLNGVLGMIQAIEGDELAPAQRARFEVARKSAENLRLLLNNLLDQSRLATGDLDLEVGEVDIALLADAALKDFESAAADKGLHLDMKVSPEACGVYEGDPVRVGQVFHNLISNAVKFTDSGSVSITVERWDGALTIQVADTGIGISAEQTQGLFGAFVRVDASLTRRHGGSGLGLAISRQIAVKMGGALDVQSSLGCGSTFTATLPLTRLRHVGEGAPDDSGEGDVAEQPPLRILVAEDNPVNQLVLKTLLRQVGIEPTIVGDGAQALTAWRDADWDVILMDIQMPVMDGVTASRAIRSGEASLGRTHTPIVAVTANVMADQVQAYRTAGMDDVVAKPVQVARLIDAIEGALAAKAAPMPVSSAAA